MMRCSTLDTPTCSRDESLDGGGVVSTCEFLLFGFDALENGDGEEVVVDCFVKVEDLEDFLVCFGLGEEGSVAFLPEEFTSSEEGF